MSGAMPYPMLLISQIIIVLLYGKVCADVLRARGYFASYKDRWAPQLVRLGAVYFSIMLVRYFIHNGLHSHEHWTGGAIPIFFHCVLASFIIVYGRYQSSLESSTEMLNGRANAKMSIADLLCSLFIITGIIAWIGYQLAPTIFENQLGIPHGAFAVSIERNQKIVMQDGVVLNADIFRPRHVEKTPTIIVRIPLSKSLKNLFYVDVMGRIWSEHGYTVVVEGTRGRYGSDGTFYPLRGDRQDGIDTLAWLAGQTWYNGKIAAWGGSAFGYTEWTIADRVDPGLSVMDIYEASSDFHQMFYPGGAFSLYSALSWAVNSSGREDRAKWPEISEINQSADGFPMVDSDLRAVGKRVAFFRDWVNHPSRDAFWKEIDGTKRSTTLKAPVLLMAGWFDPFLPTELKDYQEIRSAPSPLVARNSRLVIGPWIHAGEITFPDGSRSEPFRALTFTGSLPWFDSILNGPASNAAPVRIFVMGANKWRSENEWPPMRAVYTPFYLSASGTARGVSGQGRLSAQCIERRASDEFLYDPKHPVPTAGGAMIGASAGMTQQNSIESRKDVLVYTTPPLIADTEATGPVKVILYAQTTAISTDFTAKLIDVFPDGAAFNLSDGIIRTRFKPGSVKELAVELWPISNVFKKGHRIRLEVSSSNFPRYDRNPNTGEYPATAVRTISALQEIHHGRDCPSRLILPIIPH